MNLITIEKQNLTISYLNGCTALKVNYTDIKLTSSYAINSATYNPIINYNNGTIVTIASDDKWSKIIDIPFTFCFYGKKINEIVIGDNGIISFDTTLAEKDCTYFFSGLPNSS